LETPHTLPRAQIDELRGSQSEASSNVVSLNFHVVEGALLLLVHGTLLELCSVVGIAGIGSNLAILESEDEVVGRETDIHDWDMAIPSIE
jgi:hypothetical protein